MLPHFLDKNFVKATFLLHKLLKSWFHETFFRWEWISRFSTLCYTLDCLEIIRTILEFVLGVNIGVSSKLSWIGVTPNSSLRSISAVIAVISLTGLDLFGSKSLEIIEVKFGALWRLGVDVTTLPAERTLPFPFWRTQPPPPTIGDLRSPLLDWNLEFFRCLENFRWIALISRFIWN